MNANGVRGTAYGRPPEDVRYEIVQQLLEHDVATADLVGTARDVYAFIFDARAAASAVDPAAVVEIAEQAKRAVEAIDATTAAAEIMGKTGRRRRKVTATADPPAERATTARRPPPGKRAPPWPEDRLQELERWCASGEHYHRIALHFDVSLFELKRVVASSGIAKRWPRRTRTLLFTPVPLDAPWPPAPAAAPEPDAPADAAIEDLEGEPVDVVDAGEPAPAIAAEVVEILEWARGVGMQVRRGAAGQWIWNDEGGFTLRQIVTRVNDLRARANLPGFADPHPDPLAVPEHGGRSMCGSSLAGVTA